MGITYSPWRSRCGFSVLEAVIVLAITAVALSLIFSIGSRASDQGFRLGRRALSASDSQVASDSLRAAINGIVLPRPVEPQRPGFASTPFHGDATHWSSSVVFDRATPCGPAGPYALVTFSIVHGGRRSALLCDVGDGHPRELVDFGESTPEISYSTDGTSWSSTADFASIGLTPTSRSFGENNKTPTGFEAAFIGPQSRRLFIRVSTTDGRFEVADNAFSGRPLAVAVLDPSMGMQ